MSVALVLLSLLGASGPCALPEPVAPADPATAAAYLEVAEEERAAGALETALAAYREALRHDPTSAPARVGLEAVCGTRRTSTDEVLARALALLDAGEPRAALAALAALAAEPSAAGRPETALLEGLARLALGEDEAAEAAMRVARTAPETAPAAALYLGILSLRRGEATEAVGLLEAARATADTRISHRAAALLPHARREGRLSIALRVGADYDSNAGLVPAGAPRPGGSGDLARGAVAALVFRPLGPSGPFLRAVGHARWHRRFPGFDLWGTSAEAGWAREHTSLALSGAVGLDYAAFGGAPYLWSPRLEMAARGLLGALVFEAQGQLRWQHFEDPAFAGYDGPHALGRLGLGWRPESGRLELGLGYVLGYQGARVAPLAALEQGPRAELWVRAARPLRVGLSVAGGWRRHAAVDPALSARREDVFADAGLALQCALGAYWSVRAQLTGRLVRSNVPHFSYERWTGGLGMVGSFGLF